MSPLAARLLLLLFGSAAITLFSLGQTGTCCVKYKLQQSLCSTTHVLVLMTEVQTRLAALFPNLNSTEAFAFYSNSLAVFYLWF